MIWSFSAIICISATYRPRVSSMEITMADKRSQLQSKSSKTMSLDRHGLKHNSSDSFTHFPSAEASKTVLGSSVINVEKETKNQPNLLPGTPQNEISINMPVSRERSSSSVGKEAETE